MEVPIKPQEFDYFFTLLHTWTRRTTRAASGAQGKDGRSRGGRRSSLGRGNRAAPHAARIPPRNPRPIPAGKGGSPGQHKPRDSSLGWPRPCPGRSERPRVRGGARGPGARRAGLALRAGGGARAPRGGTGGTRAPLAGGPGTAEAPGARAPRVPPGPGQRRGRGSQRGRAPHPAPLHGSPAVRCGARRDTQAPAVGAGNGGELHGVRRVPPTCGTPLPRVRGAACPDRAAVRSGRAALRSPPLVLPRSAGGSARPPRRTRVGCGRARPAHRQVSARGPGELRRGLGARSQSRCLSGRRAAVPQHKESSRQPHERRAAHKEPPAPAPRRRALQCTGDRGHRAGSAEPSPCSAHGPTRGQRCPQPGGCCGAGGDPAKGPPRQRGPAVPGASSAPAGAPPAPSEGRGHVWRRHREPPQPPRSLTGEAHHIMEHGAGDFQEKDPPTRLQ